MNGQNHPSRGIELMADERVRQLFKLGYDADNDDKYTDNSLAWAGTFYAFPGVIHQSVIIWPWAKEFNKKVQHSRIEQLTIAGALIAAEIDRLFRLDEKENEDDFNPS